MGILFRVGFEGESFVIECEEEGKYVVRTMEEGIVHLLDDELEASEPKRADTFERALALMPGWEHGEPLLVDPTVADCVSAALSSGRRTSNAWNEWLKLGKIVKR